MVIDESSPATGSVDRIVSQHKTVRAARETACSIHHNLCRRQGNAAAAVIALYRSEVVFKVGAMASAESAWPIDTSNPQP